MKASVIIRTKNEQKWFGQVLYLLTCQTEKNFEVILVDSGSTDQTLSIVKKYHKKLKIKITQIKPEQFTYPYACNIGAERAKGDFLVYISGHSIPINDKWLTSGLKNFNNEKVAGVYGPVYPLPDASLTEKIFYNLFSPLSILTAARRIIKKPRMGILGNTNAIIRRNLWQKHHFDERYIDGGEDGEWAKYYLDRGYTIIRNRNFAVYHSHSLPLIPFIKQYFYWRKLYRQFSSKK